MMRSALSRIAVTTIGALLAACILTRAAAEPVDHLGVPGPILFDGKQFSLAWSSRPNADYTKQEYLPAGQDLENWEQMLLVERVTGDLQAMDAVRAQVEMLQSRQGSDPLMNMDLIRNEATGEVLLDFIVSSQDGAGNLLVEWNAYRYAPAPGSEAGVLLFGVSHRSYGAENARSFLEGLRTLRPAQIGALAGAPMPQAR